MGIQQLGTILLLNVVGMLTPGPDIFLISRIATRSRRHALAAAAGVATGLVLWVSLTVFGAAALLTAYPQLLGFIQLIGGAWIIWMGVGMLRSARQQFKVPLDLENNGVEALFGSPMRCFRQGLLTNLSNPKVVLYFGAIIAPLMPREPSIGVAVLVIAAIVTTSLIGFSTLAVLLSTKVMRKRFFAMGPWLDFGAGLFFCVAGVALMVEGARDLLALA